MNTILLVVAVIPPAIRLAGYFASKSTDSNIKTLANRALIIAEALEQTNFSGVDKKEIAINKLIEFAKEISVKLTLDQADDYIESSVSKLRTMGVKKNDNN